MTLERTPACLLQAGVKAHKTGDLKGAEELYQEALHLLGLGGGGDGADLEDRSDRSPSAEAAELLHLLGALKVQKLVGEDDEAEASESVAEELCVAQALLRGALAVLPGDASVNARARLLCSLGTALLHAPGRRNASPGCGRSKGASLEEALQLLREACKLDETRWAAWYNAARGMALLLLEKEKAKSCKDEIKALEEEKLQALRQALRLKPRHAGCLYRLGMSLRERGDHEEAAKALEDFLSISGPSPQEAEASKATSASSRRKAGARHWLAVLRGETTASAPAEYVAGLFDGYADRFDEHLVETLEYRTPELLSQELVQMKAVIAAESDSEEPLFGVCADLGCGTGLMGPYLRELGVTYLEGVDLSSKMLQVAKEKQRGYDRLLCGDLVDVFQSDTKFDLVVAADVFVYVGDLAPVLRACHARLADCRSVVAFSTEAPPRSGSANEHESALAEGTFKLAETGRYIHTASYVRQCAEEVGLKLWKRSNVILRRNGGKPVYGHLHILRKMEMPQK